MITSVVLSPAVDKIYYIENFRAGGLYRIKSGVKSAGGKGANVARVASILGERVISLGFKAGQAGDWLEAELRRIGVDTRFVSAEGETRTNINIIDRFAGTETEILEEGPWISGQQEEAFLEVFGQVLPQTKVLVCSGGLPRGMSADFYKKLIEMAASLGVPAILDTSNEMLTEGIKGKPYMVKPNRRELARYAGRKLAGLGEMVEACAGILGAGVKYVVTSMGADGALMVTENRVLHAKPPRLEVVNTIGSGDSMVAGFASAIVKGMNDEDMLRLAMACGAANTQFKEVGMVSLELVDKFLGEIVITRPDV